MDRCWNYVAPGKTASVDLSRFTAAGIMRDYATKRRLHKKHRIREPHRKLVQRAILEQSGLPTNQQYYLRWGEREWLEVIIDEVGWNNLGTNTLLQNQGDMGRTPLIRAVPMLEMRNLWMMKLAQLEREVQEFKLKHGADPKDTDGDFIRCFPSPVLEPGYLGLTLVCEVHQFDLEAPARLPYRLEVCGHYPRYLQIAEAGTFLSMSVSRNGTETVHEPGEERFRDIVPRVRMFVRENAGSIARLGAKLNADVVSLDMEWVPPDWLRVFDFDSIPLPMAAKIEAQLPPIISSEPKPRFAF